MDKIYVWVQTVALVAVALGILPWLHERINLERQKIAESKASKKSKDLDFALKIADQAVLAVEKIAGSGEAQNTSAVIAVKQRLEENGLGNKFTDEQISQIIHSQYIHLKSDGSIDLVKTPEQKEVTENVSKTTSVEDSYKNEKDPDEDIVAEENTEVK